MISIVTAVFIFIACKIKSVAGAPSPSRKPTLRPTFKPTNRPTLKPAIPSARPNGPTQKPVTTKPTFRPFLTKSPIHSASPSSHRPTTTSSSTCDIQWYLCPFTNTSQDDIYRGNNSHNNNSSLIITTSYLQSNCQTLTRLGTVLASLQQASPTGGVSDSLYYDQNLASIPDITVQGRDYYTHWYVGQFTSPQDCEGNTDITLLRFRGINYSPEFYFNGVALSDPSVPTTGMFHPYTLNISPYLNHQNNDEGSFLNSIAVLVHPPEFPGSALNGGQGGDHEIARNVQSCSVH